MKEHTKPMQNSARRDFLKKSGAALGVGAACAIVPQGLRAASLPMVQSTTAMINDIIVSLGAGSLDARAIMGSGIDPHSYRPTRSDILALQQADLIFYNGLALEAQLVPLLQKLADRKPVYAVADGLRSDQLLAHPDYPDRFDPHFWMSPALWSEVARFCLDALSRNLPGQSEPMTERYVHYAAQIEQLRQYVVDAISSIPKERRILVTAHDAFGYFGRAFDLEVVGVQGLSTESEAGLYRINELVDMIVKRQVPAVFVESSVAERNVQALVEGAAAKGHEVRIGGQLFSDAMGFEGTYEGSYIGMIDHNATTIARALGGQVPNRGWRGQLGLAG